jgi:hypothetical protein
MERNNNHELTGLELSLLNLLTSSGLIVDEVMTSPSVPSFSERDWTFCTSWS